MQNMIDLMPEDLRQQCQAGARKGQMLIAFTLAGAVLVALATHSTMTRNKQRGALEDARVHADQVLHLDQQRSVIEQAMLDDVEALRLY